VPHAISAVPTPAIISPEPAALAGNSGKARRESPRTASIGSAAGSGLMIAGVGTALIAWGTVVFAIIPLQQHHLIGVAPDEPSGVLSLNSSAVYVGQGLGAGLGSLVLGYAPLAALGYVGALLAIVALVTLVLGARLSVRPTEHAPSSNPLRRSLPLRGSIMRHDRVPREAASAALAANDKGLC
jgi:hypothetical protein